ncbi:unnamed protein product [Peronospora destructor]|uniref:Uncharacterized protein n=1 Tax=Peronospora destructor TaxID=86335 RepID=A0AAV0VBC5_9STRA|nr:unnamed protein product [Peronospora destructor]CAI5746757.1 unnamed protein product [Peronospora destructor]
MQATVASSRSFLRCFGSGDISLHSEHGDGSGVCEHEGHWHVLPYQSRSVDEGYQDKDDEATISRVYYSDLAASVQPSLEVVDASQNTEDIQVETRVLTREQRDYDPLGLVDEDSLHPMPVDFTQSVATFVVGWSIVVSMTFACFLFGTYN